MRQKIVAGNWKMNTSLQEGLDLSLQISKQYNAKDIKLILIPPFTHIASVYNQTKNTGIDLGAQNCSTEQKGAFTGEISVEMISSVNAKYVIVGHSERRSYYGETNAILKQKLDIVLKNELTPILCCGETLEERNAGNHFKIVKSQIEESSFHLSADEFKKLVIAYEPVWAIGTGVTASSAQAEEMHSFIRNEIAKKYGYEIAEYISILYGGSCKSSNAKELFVCKNIDGGLIGGAALNADEFIAISNSF